MDARSVPSPRPPRVTVTGQHTLLIDSIGRCLTPACRVHQVALETFGCISAACDAVLGGKTGLVVLVLSEQDAADPVVLVEELSARGAQVLVTGQVLDAAMLAELMDAGALRVSPAHEGIADLARVVHTMAGWTAVVRRTGHARPRPRNERPRASESLETRRRLSRLTAAETRILWCLMHGQTVDDIASAHVVSVATVRSQVQVVLRKLQVRNQLAAVAMAWRSSWRPAAATLVAA